MTNIRHLATKTLPSLLLASGAFSTPLYAQAQVPAAAAVQTDTAQVSAVQSPPGHAPVSQPPVTQADTPQVAAAQRASNSDDIVVTANRREENLQKVGLSIAAATGATLQQLNIARPEELTRLFPGFTSIPNAGSAATSYNIRGVGQSDFSEHEEQPVAAYQDGVYIANAAATGFPIFDLQRVELLRGPQGTLFGRNATGGLVQFLSNQPQAGFNGYAILTGGDYNLHRGEGAVNYGNDIFAVRAAGYYSDRKGYVKNDNGPNLLAEEQAGVRVQARYTPSSAVSMTLRLEGFNTNSTSQNKALPSYNNPATGLDTPLPANVDAYGTGAGNDFYGFRDAPNPYLESVNTAGYIRKRSRTIALNNKFDLGDVTLFTITSYNHTRESYGEDTDGTTFEVFRNNDDTHVKTFTQELRLQGEEGHFRWTAGGYFLNVAGNYFIENQLPTICNQNDVTTCSYGPGLGTLNGQGYGAGAASQYYLRTRSEAAFAQGEYDLTSKLTFTLGARYTWDQQLYHYQFECTQDIANGCLNIFGGNKIAGSVANLGVVNTVARSANGVFGLKPTFGPNVTTVPQNHGNWSGKVGFNYKVATNNLLYATINRGIKSSGYVFSYDGTALPTQLTFKPEKLLAYEIGSKNKLFDGKLTANIDYFHYDYHNFQTFQFTGVTAIVLNRNGYANGGELELAAHPVHGLDFNFGAAYDNFWVKDINLPTGGTGRQHAINAPKWQLNWGASKSFPLPDDLTLRFGYNGRYTGSRFYNIQNYALIEAPGVVTHDADVSIETQSGVTLRAFVTNFTNKAIPNALFDQTGQGFYLAHYSAPREFGASVGYKF